MRLLLTGKPISWRCVRDQTDAPQGLRPRRVGDPRFGMIPNYRKIKKIPDNIFPERTKLFRKSAKDFKEKCFRIFKHTGIF
jgi:hypothetical protein